MIAKVILGTMNNARKLVSIVCRTLQRQVCSECKVNAGSFEYAGI